MALIALVRPPQIMPSDVLTVTQGVPHIAIAYLTASLKEADHQVMVIDALGEDLHKFHRLNDTRLLINGLTAEEIVQKIPKSVQCIGISCAFSNEWIYTQIVIQAIAKHFPKTPIITGGEHITADPEYSLRDAPGITVCVLGEGEETIVEVVDVLLKKRSLYDINGIAFIDSGGKFVKTSPRARIRAIDEIPWPSWEEYPLENYLSQGFGFNEARGRPMPLIASRGCPYQCTFCSNPFMWTTRWYARDPSDVVKEIKYYIDKYKIDHVEFYDLTTIIKKSWILEFTKVLLEENIQITWTLPSGTRSEALDQEVLYMLKKTGCNKLTYAPESGSARTLKRIKKFVKIKNMLSSIRLANKEGISVKANLIFGFPDQTLGECIETYWFMLKAAWVGMSDVAIFQFNPYPGSELFFQLVDEGKIPKDSELYNQFLSGNVVGELIGIQSWSEHISNFQLKFLLVFGVFWFYGWQFLFRPYRFLGIINRLIQNRPVTTLDLLIDGVIRNFIKGRKRKSIDTIDQIHNIQNIS